MPPHISLNSNHSNLNLLNNSEASNLLFKELHKLVSGNNSSSNKGLNAHANGPSSLNGNSNNNPNHLEPLVRNNSDLNSLSKKLLNIKPPSVPTNLINSQILNSNINNTNTTTNQIYSQLQLRSDELDRVKTHVSSTSTQNKLNSSNSSSLLQLTDFLKNTSTKTKLPQTNQSNEQYSNDDISLINLNRKSEHYGLNSSFEFGTMVSGNGGDASVLVNNSAIQMKTNDYQRLNLPSSQTQRKVFLQKSESDSSIKQPKNFNDPSTSESNQHQTGLNAKILKVIINIF